ncbi:RNAPII transcription regulator C-terminal-domain-containing protein [Chytridium lagenaria]|nr:RNAPII transcription regulator C-terminal-domain-containing protein [Chytridium lagenaria]
MLFFKRRFHLHSTTLRILMELLIWSRSQSSAFEYLSATTIMQKFLMYIFKRLHNPTKSAMRINEILKELTVSIIALMASSAAFKDGNSELYQSWITDFLTSVFTQLGNVDSTKEASCVSAIVAAAVRSLPESLQIEVVQNAVAQLFVLPGLQQVSLFDEVRGIVFAGAVCNLRPSVPLPVDAAQFIQKAQQYLDVAPNGDSSLYTSFVVATAVNRLATKGSNIDSYLSLCGFENRATFFTDSDIGAKPTFLLKLLVLRALILKGHPSGMSMLDSLLSSFETRTDLSAHILDSFFVLIDDNPYKWDSVLTKESFAVASPFWKQKIFSKMSPFLMQAELRNRQDNLKSTLYSGLILDILRHAAPALYLKDMESIIPVLLNSIQLSPTPKRVNDALQIMRVGIENSPQALSGNLHSIIDALVKLASRSHPNLSTGSEYLMIRLAAVDCLGKLPAANMPREVLVSIKDNVLRGLKVTLDDPKRVVRKAAGNARARWFNV